MCECVCVRVVIVVWWSLFLSFLSSLLFWFVFSDLALLCFRAHTNSGGS